MPSQRKRIGFLPSEEVHRIIDKLCSANEFSQSKVTGLLVEEALRSRGVLSESFNADTSNNFNFINYSFKDEPFLKNNNSPASGNNYTISKKEFAEDINMIHEFIEFKFFKKVMKQNKNIFE